MTKLKQDGATQKENTMHTPTDLMLPWYEKEAYIFNSCGGTVTLNKETRPFICLAVNAHEELVRACEKAFECWTETYPADEIKTRNEARKILREALAKAGVKV